MAKIATISIPRLRYTVPYAASLAALLLLLGWLEAHFVIIDHKVQLYAGLIAALFLILGIWLSRRLWAPVTQTVIVEKEVLVPAPQITIATPVCQQSEDAGISSREMEVLQLMSTGLSNQEIADQLYVSLSTVKTHVSNIFIKLDVKRRTQAVQRARELNILAGTAHS